MDKLIPHINFSGNCREAMTFYQACLGGDLQLSTVGESPVAAEFPPEAQNGIIHASLDTGSFTLMAADMAKPDESISGISLTLLCSKKDELERVFELLSKDGSVFCPLGPAFWGGTFGVTTDRYGVTWMLHLPAQE